MAQVGDIADGKMKEYDPSAERQYPLMYVKAVDPGCTLEFQIENCQTGEVFRITTTDNPIEDQGEVDRKLSEVFLQALRFHEKRL